MVAKVDIFNYALSLLGQSPISDPDGSGVAEYCRGVYEITRRSLIEQHPWNFAIKRASLAQEVTAPDFEFDYQYTLPSDYIRLVRIYESASHWREEDGMFLTDDDTVEMMYIADITDVTKFSPMFSQVLAYDIAIAIAHVLTQNGSLASMLMGKRQELYIKAKMVDGQKTEPNRTKFKSNIELAMDSPNGLIE